MKNNKKLSEQGFTLIELAIVIIVIGIIFALFSSALLSYIQKSRIYKTETRMVAIQDAIEKFLNINDRLPCPASQTAGPGNAAFNIEATTAGLIVNCNGGASPAAVPRFGNGAGRLRTGGVPVRSLNLPDEYALDAWGNKLRYTVTANLATPGQYANDMGRIRVTDSNGFDTVTPVGTAHYVIVSHGENGRGAFSEAGAAVVACNFAGVNDDEGQNCNNNRRYVDTLLKSDVAGLGFYDDFVVYKAEERPDFQVPAGAVVAFNSNNCPPTWELADGVNTSGAAAPAEPDMRGNFVIGRTTPGVPIVSPRYNVTATGPTDNITYPLGSTGQDPLHLIPPFVSLIYCVKD